VRRFQRLGPQDRAIPHTRLYFDQVQIMTQLGLMPEPAIA